MAETEWFWEGNVVRAVAKHLSDRGWAIEKLADTASGQTGADIQAKKDGKTLVVEVKGYPSKHYERGANKGKPKPTNPATQARHWIAEAIFTALMRQAEDSSCQVAIAFPEFTTYTNLLRRIGQALVKLGLIVFIVRQSGVVVVQAGNEDAA